SESGVQEVRELRELDVDADRDVVVDLVRRSRGRAVRARHHYGQGRELVVEADGEVQGVLAALVLRLVERLLHRRHALGEGLRRLRDGFITARGPGAMYHRLHLLAAL